MTNAHAAASTTSEIVNAALPTDYVWRTVFRLPDVQLEAGQKYLFAGSFGATADTAALQEASIRCDGTQSQSSSQNHDGVGVDTIAVHWLFVAPATDTYTCYLRGKAGKCIYTAGIVGIPMNPKLCTTDPRWTLTVVSGQLSMDTSSRTGSTWRQSADTRFGDPKKGRPRAIDVLWSTTTLPAGTEAVQVHTGPEITVESTGASTPLRVRLVHFVRQLRPDGSYCKVTSVTEEKSISSLLHHYKFNRVQNVRLDPACGTTDVNVKVYVYWVSGHGGVVHGPNYSSAYALAA